MKQLGGMPLSAYVAYSRKRKNYEIEASSKKIRKKRVRLSEMLNPTKSSTDDAKEIASKKSVPPSKKKKKKRILVNGNSISGIPKLAREKRKIKNPKAQKKLSSLKNVNDSKASRKEGEEILESKKTIDSKQPLKKNNKVSSPLKNDTSNLTNSDKASQSSQSPLKNKIPENSNENPTEVGKSLFQWLIHPVSVEDFFENNWERAPLQIKRNKSRYYKLLMSSPIIDNILRNFHILFTKNIDITSYSNGQRETHNPPGRALPSVVWDYYSNGCSVRMLNPQTFIPKLHALNATLQEFFGCFVGANSYLTPPDSQGFAPHYDDIEAFILQVEGKKRWRLYKPKTEREYLPRYSSKNFDPSEIGEPILDTVVNAGDLLYFPRGTIHQGETIDGTHSLHITLSVYQKNSWCDFLEKLLPEALENAIDKDSRFREGLPLDYLRNIGLVHSSNENEARKNFVEKTKDLLHKLIDYIDVDKIADRMAKGNIHDFLPPVLTPQEQECSVLKDGERITDNGSIENRVEIEPDTRIRLLRSHCIRLVEEEDSMRIYYSTENSKEYREYEPQFLEVGKELAPAVQEIIRRYPDFIKVDDLPIDGEDNKVQVARDLWEKCIVVTDVPLPILE